MNLVPSCGGPRPTWMTTITGFGTNLFRKKGEENKTKKEKKKEKERKERKRIKGNDNRF